jgi:hypothetical protein
MGSAQAGVAKQRAHKLIKSGFKRIGGFFVICGLLKMK